MEKFKYIFLVVCINMLSFTAWTQSYNKQQIQLAEQLESLSKNVAPELAYIQTSKDIYETGEDLWFKVYLLDAKYLIPSFLSNTLYLQLINETNKKVVWQEKYEIQDGFANGRAYLASTLPEGDYLLTVYTPNSFFYDTNEFYATRKIKIKTDLTSRPSIAAKFDKPFYNRNDTIRIKLFPLSAQRDSLYAEITATLKQGNKRMEKEQTTTNGQGKTTIVLPPQDLIEGLQVTVNIKYKDRTESLILPIPTKSNAIQFTTFPEGGNLISGIQNKLAFKAVNPDGNPVDIKGTVFEDGTPIFELKSTHSGMGSIDFIPIIGKKYLVRFSEPAIDSTFILPEIYPEGISLQLVGRDKESLSFRVTQSPKLKPDNIYLRVQCRGVVYGMTMARLSSDLRIKVPLSDLPQGIAEVTLFNSNLVPVAERLVYVNQDRKLNITADLSQSIYPTRGEVSLKIIVKDEKGKPISANLGVTVFDKIYQNSNDSINILSHFYLSTQLKGRIYNPSFYFNSKSKSRDEALDLLMLTQGWRKYIWSESNLKIYTNVRHQVVFDGTKGKLYTANKKDVIPQDQAFVIAYSPNRDKKSAIIMSDSTGLFAVSPLHLKTWEGDYVYLKPPISPKFKALIQLTNPFDSINKVMRAAKIYYPLTCLLTAKEEIPIVPFAGQGAIMIKEVTIKGRTAITSGGKFLGKLDSLSHLNDYVCSFNVLNCPRHVYEPGSTKPVEGRRYFVIEHYNTPSESMKEVVYHSTAPLMSEEELLKKYNLSRVKAYYENVEYYKPNYDKESEDSVIPDFRNTLLWEPAVITDENGEATLSFYCSDINTGFVGRIEGVSGEGLLGTGGFNFKVRKLLPTP